VHDTNPPPESTPTPGQTDPPRVVNSSELFVGARVVVIEHAGQQYRLLITRNDRLILQK
jgi:hemin uptake protein HemP